MTLLDAPVFDERKSQRNRNLLIAGISLIVLVAVVGVGGFFLNHGWFFSNLPAEWRVGSFFQKVESNDLAGAYAIWNNDPQWQQHPEQYKNYTMVQFEEDWGPSGEWGTIKSHHVDMSIRTGSGIAMAVKLNGRPKPAWLWYERSNHKLSYSPVQYQY